MDEQQFKEAAHAAIEDITSYTSSLPTRPVLPSITPNYLASHLPPSAPSKPESFLTSILPDISRHILPGLTHWQSPNFMAFFPATTSFPSMLGELYSAAYSAPAFNWLCSPVCTDLEGVVLSWVGQMLGLPKSFWAGSTACSSTKGGGVIQGSASEAVICVMTAARDVHVRAALTQQNLLPPTGETEEAEKTTDLERTHAREDLTAEIRGKLVVLGSSQSHSSTQKAANVLGLRYRSVPAGKETGYRMTGEKLEEALAKCEEKGLVPCYVTATLGTTNTCAIDEFEGIADVKKRYEDRTRKSLWVHVDAAYVGMALCCEELRDGCGAQWFDHFESFDVNLHKWGLVNFDASCLFLRNTEPLTTSMAINPSYLSSSSAPSTSNAPPNYRDYQIPLGRRFRSLKIWFVLRTYGTDYFKDMIRRHIKLGELFARLCLSEEGRRSGVEVVTGPAFGLTVFMINPALWDVVESGAIANGEARNESVVQHTTEQAPMNTDTAVTPNNASITPKGPSRTGAEKKVPSANDVTKKVYECLNARGDIFLTSSVIEGAFVIRLISANERANEVNVRGAWEKIKEETAAVRKEVSRVF